MLRGGVTVLRGAVGLALMRSWVALCEGDSTPTQRARNVVKVFDINLNLDSKKEDFVKRLNGNLPDQENVLVVGVMGGMNAGKSTTLNELFFPDEEGPFEVGSKATTAGVDAVLIDRPSWIPNPTKRTLVRELEGGTVVPGTIDVKQRLLLLDVEGIWSQNATGADGAIKSFCLQLFLMNMADVIIDVSTNTILKSPTVDNIEKLDKMFETQLISLDKEKNPLLRELRNRRPALLLFCRSDVQDPADAVARRRQLFDRKLSTFSKQSPWFASSPGKAPQRGPDLIQLDVSGLRNVLAMIVQDMDREKRPPRSLAQIYATVDALRNVTQQVQDVQRQWESRNAGVNWDPFNGGVHQLFCPAICRHCGIAGKCEQVAWLIHPHHISSSECTHSNKDYPKESEFLCVNPACGELFNSAGSLLSLGRGPRLSPTCHHGDGSMYKFKFKWLLGVLPIPIGWEDNAHVYKKARERRLHFHYYPTGK